MSCTSLSDLLLNTDAPCILIGKQATEPDSLPARYTHIKTQDSKTPDEVKWEAFVESLILTESQGNPNAIGDNGKAVGVLQIWTICVDEANRILGYDEFTYDDRYDRDRSIEIFNVIQDKKNPEHDFERACRIWNPRHSASYYSQTISRL